MIFLFLAAAVLSAPSRCFALALGTAATTGALERWCDSHGVERSCRVGTTPWGGRGLVATRPLLADEVALRVPLSICLVENDCEEDHWAGRMTSRLLLRDPTDVYRLSLPTAPDSLGRWEDDELAELQDATLETEAASVFFWRHEQSRLNDGGEDFLDTLDLVCSRSLRIGDRLVMVPLLDMANHATGGGYYTYDAENDSVCLHAGSRGVQEEAEITMSYGDQRPASDFVLHYGFVLPFPHRSDRTRLDDGTELHWRDLQDPSAVAQAARATLDAFPTTLAEDQATDLDESTPRHKLALQYRINRKLFIQAAAGSGGDSPR